jgi:hypothetical protein
MDRRRLYETPSLGHCRRRAKARRRSSGREKTRERCDRADAEAVAFSNRMKSFHTIAF